MATITVTKSGNLPDPFGAYCFAWSFPRAHEAHAHLADANLLCDEDEGGMTLCGLAIESVFTPFIEGEQETCDLCVSMVQFDNRTGRSREVACDAFMRGVLQGFHDRASTVARREVPRDEDASPWMQGPGFDDRDRQTYASCRFALGQPSIRGTLDKLVARFRDARPRGPGCNQGDCLVCKEDLELIAECEGVLALLYP